MMPMLARNWWVLVLRGVLAVVFGLLALIWPQLTVLSLVLLFGVYTLVDGVLAVVSGLASIGRNSRWWGALLGGVVSIVVGLLTLLYPGTTTLVLLYFIAAWAILSGLFLIVAAIQLRRVITSEWFMAITGVLSVLFGVALVLFPGAGALGLIWMIGGFAILLGVLLILVGFRLRGLPRETGTTRTAGA